MKRALRKKVGGVLLGGAAMLVILAACGGSTGEAAPIPTATQTAATATAATATTALTPSPTPPAAPTATVAPAPTPSPVASNNDLLARGKLLFENTAGSVGCALCHGLDGKGNKTIGAPQNRGKTEAEVRQALVSVEMMRTIKLTDEEITAVVAYLQYLNEQP